MPLGKDMAQLQRCPLEKPSSDRTVPCPASACCRKQVDGAPAALVGPVLPRQLIAAVQQQCFAAKTSVLPKSPTQEVPFTD